MFFEELILWCILSLRQRLILIAIANLLFSGVELLFLLWDRFLGGANDRTGFVNAFCLV